MKALHKDAKAKNARPGMCQNPRVGPPAVRWRHGHIAAVLALLLMPTVVSLFRLMQEHECGCSGMLRIGPMGESSPTT
eukprot:s1070_g17.t1